MCVGQFFGIFILDKLVCMSDVIENSFLYDVDIFMLFIIGIYFYRITLFNLGGFALCFLIKKISKIIIS